MVAKDKEISDMPADAEEKVIIETDAQARSIVPRKGKNKDRFSARDGLELEVRAGKKGVGRFWIHRYRIDGKTKEIQLGTYNLDKKHIHMGLRAAKEALVEVKKQMREGIDPALAKKETKIANKLKRGDKAVESEQTFKMVSLGWLEWKLENEWAASTKKNVERRLSNHVWPFIGEIPITKLTVVDTALVLSRMIKQKQYETADRLVDDIRSVFKWGMGHGMISKVEIPLPDPGTVVPTKKKRTVKPGNFPALTDEAGIGKLLRAIDGYKGNYIAKMASKMLPYLAVRSEAFRQMKWKEIDLEERIWTMPAADRKLGDGEKQDPSNFHLVPLSNQVIALLEEMRVVSGHGEYVFPNVQYQGRHMSENTVNDVLKRLGYKGIHVGHGWRSSLSTIMNERRFRSIAIERQLEHVVGNEVSRKYDRGELFEERRELMQAWANLLDELRAAV